MNLPNKLTLTRIILVPVFMIFVSLTSLDSIVDGNVCVSSEEPLYPGQFYDVLVDDSDLYDLYGTVVK